MKKLYLALAIVGAILPYVFFMHFLQTEGFDLPAFVRASFANSAAGGISADLFFASFVFWLFMFMQRKRAKGPSSNLAISAASEVVPFGRSETAA
jgi:hypothetical protein